jgi:flagellar basal-body rod modification protein FlgD
MTISIAPQIINNNVTSSVTKQEIAMKKQQEMYFKLLMAQLKNQDPENTTDSNEMIQTFMQMQNGQAMLNMQHQLESLNNNFSKNFMQSMTGMIGKYALTKNNQFILDENSFVAPISYKIDNPGLHRLDIKILDDEGQIVHQDKIDNIKGDMMNELNIGVRDPEGNLTLEPGLYKIEIYSFTKDNNKPVNLEIFTSNKIMQVLHDGSIITNDNQKVSLREILALQEKPLALA